jgi:hypothetical protein
MATIPLARIRAGAATSATIVALIVTAGLGNQALSSWRLARENSGGLSGWVSELFSPMELVGWRFTSQSGPDGTDHWLAPLVFNAVLVIGTALLVAYFTRGSNRLSTLFAVWGLVTLVGGIAAAASTPLMFAGVAGPSAKAFGLTVPLGLSLGFIVGAIAGVAACVFGGGGTATSNGAEAGPSATPVSSLENTSTLPTNWPISLDE